MRKRNIRLLAAAFVLLCVFAAAGLAAVLTDSGGDHAAAAAPVGVPAAKEALEFARSAAGQATQGVPLPVAREKAGKEGMREIWSGAAAEIYADQAFPHANIDFAQVRESLEQAKGFASKGDSLKSDWEEVGPFTLNVAREATQTNGIPTQWAGRTTALAVDANCDEHSCRLYVGAAGGGVWRTDNALLRSPNWEPLTDGLDTTSVGDILIDPHDRSGKTIYLGTGEPSGSSDSEAGLGLYKSTDRGEHWSLVPGSRAVAKDRAIGHIAIDPRDARHVFIGTAVARHSLSGVTGGRYTPPNAPTLGIYESTDGGASFHLVLNRPQDPVDPTTPNGLDFYRGGVSDIEYDPVSPGTVYATLFEYGVFRSTDNGATWQNIYVGEPDDGSTNPGSTPLGIRYEVAGAKLPNGKTRLYVYEGANEADNNADGVLDEASFVLRSDDARAASPTFTKLSSSVDGTPGFSSFDICGQQCSYDMPIASPPGKPDEVWIGGQTQYGELPPYAGADRSNGRNLVRSTNAGVSFTDMTGDARDPNEDGHPDVQTLAFVPGSNPTIAFIGSDGGVIRTNGRYVDDSSDCDEPARNLSGINLNDCRDWLSSIPQRLITINSGLRTLQFQDLSPNPNNPLGDVIGGTQDNGTLAYSGTGTWLNFVSGDGGQSGIDAKQGNIRYHTYNAVQGDVNFRGNDPQFWSWIFDPLLFSPEGSAFYIPFTADPVVSKTAFAGAGSVWRTQDAGGDQSFLENHCSVLGGPRSDRLNTGVDSGCGDWEKLGPGSLITGPATDKGTGYVVAVERARTNTGTLWAGTRRGRVFVSKNADANDPAAQVQEPDCCGTGMNERQTDVAFTRIDTPVQPRRFVSGIAIDSRDSTGNTAFVSFSGYNAYTPTTPGHLFKAVFNPATGTATWTNIDFNIGDLPILDVEVDPATGDLYAAYDYGVLRLRASTTTWVRAADGLPKVAVYELALTGGKKAGDRTLYAATHGRGGFRLALPKAHD